VGVCWTVGLRLMGYRRGVFFNPEYNRSIAKIWLIPVKTFGSANRPGGRWEAPILFGKVLFSWAIADRCSRKRRWSSCRADSPRVAADGLVRCAWAVG
jgi:hypothetical protein